MNRQETFDKVAKHLLAQGRRAVLSAPGTYGDNVSCRYRAPNSDKCAVGCLIADEHYDEAMEGGILLAGPFDDTKPSASIKVSTYCRNVLGAGDEDMRFLRALQCVHDYEAPETWRDGLADVAINYNLEMGALL